MDEYKKIFEVYKNNLILEMSSGQGAVGYDQQRKPSNYKQSPSNDYKNSYGPITNTSQLPGGSASKFSPAGVSQGVSIDEEEVVINGYGKMTRGELNKLYYKVKAEIQKLKNKDQIESKLGLLKVLNKHMKR